MRVRRAILLGAALLPLLLGGGTPPRPDPLAPLEGVNLSGAETSCVRGPALPANVDLLAAALRSWPIATVRLPLNEDCWLGINGMSSGGPAYRAAVADLARGLERDYMVILDLQWSAPGAVRATAVQPMPDADHAPLFWSQVAAEFRAERRVMFDLFNEPEPVSWTCWRDGCPQDHYFVREDYERPRSGTWQAVGMAALVAAVRRAGARQPILLSGIARGNDLTQWWLFQPPDDNLVAAWHAYPGLPCNTARCWDAAVAPLARHQRVIASEVGEADGECSAHYVAEVVDWLEAHRIGYLAWSFNPWGSCSYELISDAGGTPAPGYGKWMFDRLSRDHAGHPPARGG
jgi:endoglucanase